MQLILTRLFRGNSKLEVHKGSDFFECFLSSPEYIERRPFTPETATINQIHSDEYGTHSSESARERDGEREKLELQDDGILLGSRASSISDER